MHFIANLFLAVACSTTVGVTVFDLYGENALLASSQQSVSRLGRWGTGDHASASLAPSLSNSTRHARINRTVRTSNDTLCLDLSL